MAQHELPPGAFHYLSAGPQPVLEIDDGHDGFRPVPLTRISPGRSAGESLWAASLAGLVQDRPWQFRVLSGDGGCDHPEFAPVYTTSLERVWMQDQSLFDYRPAERVASSRVIKIERFGGSLVERPLYIYLPRGYDQHADRRFPVLYMHDGQNVFEAFVEDSYVGSWQAERAADLLIRQGLMRECIIVGVGHGKGRRMLEYLPPYASLATPAHGRHSRPETAQPGTVRRARKPQRGRADRMVAFYRDEVAPWLARNYRVLCGRADTATCGSSMGGLFSLYIAWEHPEFARNHAAMSTAFWAARNRAGERETIERMRRSPRRDVRLWLDSGTRSTPRGGDDGLRDTLTARAALLQAGYVEGVHFEHYTAQGALHNEAAWAARLPFVFQFLLPPPGRLPAFSSVPRG